MTGTLRDRLAAVLGPGNDDETAYAQADSVLWVLVNLDRDELMTATSTSDGENCANCNCALARDDDTWIHAYDGRRWCFNSPVAEAAQEAPAEYWSVKGTTQYGFPEQRLIHDLPSRDTADRWAADFLKRARRSGYEPSASVHKQHDRYGMTKTGTLVGASDGNGWWRRNA